MPYLLGTVGVIGGVVRNVVLVKGVRDEHLKS